MNLHLLASIIQGEAGGMGAIGMVAVALSLHCRIWQHGHSEERIAGEWMGRADPGPIADMLAVLVMEHRLPDNPYYYCMGNTVDVEDQHFKRGDWVILDHDGVVGLHLYKIQNVPWEQE